MKYAVLCNPGHSRVYFESSLGFISREFIIAAAGFTQKVTDAGHEIIGGVPYFTFEAEEFSENEINILTRLSFFYALFKVESVNGETLLRPVAKTDAGFIDGSMGRLLKYSGKTNEVFTAMLINIARHSLEGSASRLLDPVMGKGTTLYEGLAKGLNVYGIEIDEGLVNEAYHYTKKFLETARYKFDYKSIRVSGENKSFTALRHTFAAAASKEDEKNNNRRTIEFIAGNSINAGHFFGKSFFDMIIGDLPYGVQHGNITSKKYGSITRNPAELLNVCLPSWNRVLRPGGVIVLAWNANVLPRAGIEDIFTKNGFGVFNGEDYLHFSHRVDQSILRDVIAAKKNA